jgi:hypothetical protein
VRIEKVQLCFIKKQFQSTADTTNKNKEGKKLLDLNSLPQIYLWKFFLINFDLLQSVS